MEDDKEMQLQDVPCEATDDVLKGEPDKDQNQSELLPLENNEDGDGQANGHGKKAGDAIYSRKKSQVRFWVPSLAMMVKIPKAQDLVAHSLWWGNIESFVERRGA